MRRRQRSVIFFGTSLVEYPLQRYDMITLNAISASKKIAADLDWPFDFSPRRADTNARWITLKPNHRFKVIAGDSTGGVFLVYGEGDESRLPILHATSEGQAGRVAANLTEWLALLMAIPYWRDLLKFSGGGKLTEMRRAAKFMEREYAEDYPELPAVRERLIRALHVPSLEDPIKILHRNVKATDCTVVSDDGTDWMPLFNSFVASDNPMWK